jgi:acetate---CoA ligase (ADP-forming)
LSELSSKELVAAYGIPVSRDILTTTATEATRAARAIGYPVVLKVCSPDIGHKSDLGLVRVGLNTATEVREAFRRISDVVATLPDALIEGILVSEQLDDGVEAVVGLSTDALFGPTVMVGLGGVLVEVLGDVAMRVPPFDRREARRMVDELRGVALLRGTRGRPAADIDALIDIVMAVQRLGTELIDDVFELDLNPVLVGAEGLGAVALDALVIPKLKGW